MDGTAWAATFARSTVNAFFRVDDVVTTALGGRNSARRALVGASSACSALFYFDNVGHDDIRLDLGLND